LPLVKGTPGSILFIRDSRKIENQLACGLAFSELIGGEKGEGYSVFLLKRILYDKNYFGKFDLYQGDNFQTGGVSNL
jgi:hypothetical protein